MLTASQLVGVVLHKNINNLLQTLHKTKFHPIDMNNGYCQISSVKLNTKM